MEGFLPQGDEWNCLLFVLKPGGRLWDPNVGGHTAAPEIDIPETIRRPQVVRARRDMDRGHWAGSWVGALFDYRPPVLALSRSEQRRLTCTLAGVTDEQLAGKLGISLSAVKKIWISVHRRVQYRIPELLSGGS